MTTSATQARADPGPRGRPGGVPYTELLSLYVLVGGAVSLLGWAIDVRGMTDWGNDGISIQPNAALAVTLTGAALLLFRARRIRAARAAGGLVAAIGGATLFQHASGRDLGIETLMMFDRAWGRLGVLSPGRMGPAGSTCWTLLGLGVISATFECPRRQRVALALSLLCVGISSLGLVGHLYGASTLYNLPRLTVIAFQTASFGFAASLSLIAALPDRGPMRLLSSSTAGGVLARRLLPALVLSPLLIGFLVVHADELRVSDVAFGSAVRTIVEIAAFVLLLWFAAAAVDRAAEETAAAGRQRLERELGDTRMLQGISTELVSVEGSLRFHDKILDAAVHVMRSDFASLQVSARKTSECRRGWAWWRCRALPSSHGAARC